MGRRNYIVTLVMLLALVGTAAPAFADEGAAPPSTATTETAPPDDGNPGEGEGTDPAEPVKTPPNPVKRYNVKKRIVFPVVGQTYFYSGFGGCRDNCTREHHGIDIMTWEWKGLPVVAATAGTVTAVTYDEGNAGCSVRIKDRYRWETRYFHLNNDVPGTDEVGHPCPAPGIEVGVEVEAGQLIGYIGDSGNAENTPAHLHFELRMPNGHPVDPYKSLKAAERVTFEWLPNDFSVATRLIAQAAKPGDATTTIVVTTQESDQLMSSEFESMWLDAPVIAVDLDNPQPALDEIHRLASRAIVLMSNLDIRWLRNQLAESTLVVDLVPLPRFETESVQFVPDATQMPVVAPNPRDRFATVVAGLTPKIWRSRQEAFHQFTLEHRSIVLDSPQYAERNLGLRSSSSPGKYADRSLIWWWTGDGWIGTPPDGTAPEPGYAYVTERMASQGTFAFLGSLAETNEMPIWKSK